MRNTTNATLAVLAVTATILGVVLVMLHVSAPAYAVGSSVSGGDYMMATGLINPNREALYVIDLTVQKMNTYEWDVQAKNLEMRAQVNLKNAFAAGAAPKGP